MTELDYPTFIARYKEGKLVFGMPSDYAHRFFTEISCEALISKIGEGLRFQRFLIMLSMIISWWGFLISLPLAIWAFHWWAVAAIPAAAILKFGHLRRVPIGRRSIFREILVLAVATLSPPMFGWGTRIHVWLVLLAISLLTGRLIYFLSSRMVKGLVLRNPKAYDFLSRDLQVIDYSAVKEESV